MGLDEEWRTGWLGDGMGQGRMGWKTGWDGREWDVMEDSMGWGLHGPAQYYLLLNSPPSHNLEMKHLPGADPELVLLSHRYEELEVSRPCIVCCHSRAWGDQCPAGTRLQSLSVCRESP